MVDSVLDTNKEVKEQEDDEPEDLEGDEKIDEDW